MSKLVHRELLHPRVTIRRVAVDVPLSLCMETFTRIRTESYPENMAIEIDGVLLVKDAP